MLSRVVYKKRRGRSILTTVAATGLLVGTVIFNGTVLAVHDEGVFQLDGNATTAGEPIAGQDNPVANISGAHDWDQVYAGKSSNTIPNPSSGAQSQAFITDITGAGDSILTGGSTKDIYSPQSGGWLWKQTSTTSVQDKDDIEHAFAAQYNVDRSGPGQTCGTGANGLPISSANCVLLYFGADRFSNSGNTTMGFWFFKNRVSPNALPSSLPTGGTAGFTGDHVARSGTCPGATCVHGDILVVSDFLIGGAAPTVSVYEWVTSGGSASTHLDLIGGGTATPSDCTQGAAPAQKATPVPPVGNNDNLCATTNANVVTSPWPFTPKSNTGGIAGNGGGSTAFGISEFMEGGVNMTALGLGNECFNTFLAETRASSSPTSTLSDFALGNFGSCNATAVTTPSASTVSPGDQIRDHIEITGHSSGGNPPTPTSPPNVFFSYCGPTATTDTAGCDGSDGAHTAGASFDNEGLTQKVAGVGQADSAYINTAASPLSPGRYCFVGTWAGDAHYTDGASDSSAGECFIVRQIPTGIVTTPKDTNGNALGTQPLALGTLLRDRAVVTATGSGGGDINGSVSFFICNPTQVTANGGTCSSGGASLGSAVSLTPIANSSPPASAALSPSPGTAANAAGTWCFRATYTVTGTTYTTSDPASDASTGECVTVGPENTSTVTTPRVTGTTTTFTTGPVNSSVTDHAVVTAVDSADGTPTGTINFFICNPTQVAANGGDCHTGGAAAGSATAAAVTGSNPPASSGDSSAVTANVIGTWCFRAEYVPGGANGANYNGSSDSSTGECFTITDSTSATSAQNWLPNDSATVAATGGSALDGTLSLQLYTGSTCATGNEVSGQSYSKTLTGATSAADRTITSSNTTYLVSSSTSVSWKMTFTSTNSSIVGTSHCESTSMTVTN